ncbi:MAG TPA: bifunctional YncE family protein/alkaline phosphatase family protein [Polyangia bacterium]|nr:bifunctional YncE family protein/alkaline phosphatase family protein [Polyangia bacterium]
MKRPAARDWDQRLSLENLNAMALAVLLSTAAACDRPPIDGGDPMLRQTSALRQDDARSRFLDFHAPAADRATSLATTVDGRSGAILPSGRFLTPEGVEVGVQAPKPFGLAVSGDGLTAATINSGASRFSVTLIRDARAAVPTVVRVDLDATFMGLTFSPDGALFYAAGGENGNVWIGDTVAGRIIGSVNLNGASHPLDRPLAPAAVPALRFKGSFPGNLALTRDGRWLYVVDQGAFVVHVIDTAAIATGTDADGKILEPDNFAAVAGRAATGRYPFGIALSRDEQTLLVTNVGMFQYTHLRPAAPVGDSNEDYPLCIPGVGFPDEVETPRTIAIKKIDASTISGLPATLRDPDGIRCGYVSADRSYTIPALGNPNVPASSSLYAFSLADPRAPVIARVAKTGPLVGEREDGITSSSGSHPNAVVAGRGAIYVSNGNHDSVAVLDPIRQQVRQIISLSVLPGFDARLKGVQPVSLALSPDERFLYVAEAGINAVGVIRLDGRASRVVGHVPTGWWPSSVKLSGDGRTMYVASAKGRGAGPNVNDQAPKHSALGTVNIIDTPRPGPALDADTRQVLRNNGFLSDDPSRIAAGENRDQDRDDDRDGPIPARAGEASRRIKHVVFINKENATHDLLLGDIVATRQGAAVDGNPAYSLGPVAAPNHHELALSFAFGDNFYLEPSVSSDGHRWLTNTYTTEFEETHWPASYGGRRRDSGDDPEVIAHYPGRIGFTDADASPEPNDYNQHGGIYAHLARHGKSFVNFGNGFEFALVDEDNATEPTGIREHANVPMEKVVRDNTDHLFPEFNTHIPDAPLPEDPDRFNRFGRFRQIFESHYVDRVRGTCQLPAYVDLYYPNDHGGGANDIHPAGPAWDFTRFVQDNDAALGLTVDLISKSPCWKDTVIFVVEDDTQNGLDHVDGFRSIFLAVSPWVKREQVTKQHISLASIFKTVDLIFGLPPLNQYDAAATDLRDLFTSQPDYAPYDYVQPAFVAKAKKSWRRHTRGIDFGHPDGDEAKLRLAIMRSEGIPRRGRTATVR